MTAPAGCAREVSGWIDQILSPGDAFYIPDSKHSVLASGKVFLPEFTGRDPEINQLIRIYNRCKNGEILAVTVHGNEGIGKTRLISQVMKMPDLAIRQICHGEFQADGILHSGFSKALNVGLNH